MEQQADMFPKPKGAIPHWRNGDAQEEGRRKKKPWTQRRAEFLEYHKANPGVVKRLSVLTAHANGRGVKGDAQRLYLDFNAAYVETGRHPKFAREYITFYVRFVMHRSPLLRGYYKINRQDGEPDEQWNRWRDWHTIWLENETEKML